MGRPRPRALPRKGRARTETKAVLERGWPELRQNPGAGGMPLICESRASPVPPKPPRPVHPLLAGQGSNVDGIVGRG